VKANVRRDCAAAFAAGCATLLLVVACQVGSRSSWPPDHSTAPPPGASPSATPSASASASTDATDGCGSATLSIDYAPYTTATLAGRGLDFVVADVVDFEPAMFNTLDGKRPPGFGMKPSSPKPNPNAETLIYTPVDVVVNLTISGPSSPGPNRFLIAGGTIGCYRMSVYPAPRVELGSRYAFILADALDAEGTNPLPLQEAKFAWPVDAAGMVTTVDGLMSIDELTAIVSTSTPLSEPRETAWPAPQATATPNP